MKRVISFDLQKGHYTADACVVWCFDDRFYKLLKAFGKQEGFKNIDLVKIAGGAKALASAGVESSNGGSNPDRDFVLGQIKTSMRLHGTKRVMLMVHRDCGGYGGSAAFADAAMEQAHHEAQLAAA
jgi:carbonic anhydrase